MNTMLNTMLKYNAISQEMTTALLRLSLVKLKVNSNNNDNNVSPVSPSEDSVGDATGAAIVITLSPSHSVIRDKHQRRVKQEPVPYPYKSSHEESYSLRPVEIDLR